MLRLGLDRHLTLSVNLVNGASCLRGPVVSKQDAKRDTKSLDRHGRHPVEGLSIDEARVIECGTEVADANGVWDLSMIGSERDEIENRYQLLTDGPAVASKWWTSPTLCRDDGTYCQIVTRYSEDEVEPVSPWYSASNYRLADLRIVPSLLGHPRFTTLKNGCR